MVDRSSRSRRSPDQDGPNHSRQIVLVRWRHGGVWSRSSAGSAVSAVLAAPRSAGVAAYQASICSPLRAGGLLARPIGSQQPSRSAPREKRRAPWPCAGRRASQVPALPERLSPRRCSGSKWPANTVIARERGHVGGFEETSAGRTPPAGIRSAPGSGEECSASAAPRTAAGQVLVDCTWHVEDGTVGDHVESLAKRVRRLRSAEGTSPSFDLRIRTQLRAPHLYQTGESSATQRVRPRPRRGRAAHLRASIAAP
jgi:hypothetical protein